MTKGDVLLATVAHNGIIGNDPSVITLPTGYDVTVTVTLPKHISGQFYITAWSDTFDVVYKITQSTHTNPDDPTQAQQRQLQGAPDHGADDAAARSRGYFGHAAARPVGGDDFTVAGRFRTRARADRAGVLYDQVYLSDTPNFVPPDSPADVGNQWLLGRSSTTVPCSRTAATPTRPPSTSRRKFPGKYVIVVANTGNRDGGSRPGRGTTPTTISATARPRSYRVR